MARQMGYAGLEEAFILETGQSLEIDQRGARYGDNIQVGRLCIDSGTVDEVVEACERLAFSGSRATLNLRVAVGEAITTHATVTAISFTGGTATGARIAANAPIAVRQAKKSLTMAAQTDLAIGYAFEIEAYNRMVPTEDRLEGVRAFNEKRRPEFKGR